MSVTHDVKAAALLAGFDLVGVAAVEELHEATQLREWLDAGYHADMAWMARNFHKRANPREIVPDARSVVSVALNYYTPTPHRHSPRHGKISRYAWGDDYHDIFKKKLKTLYASIQAIIPHAEGRYYVDTGPVLDKAWAVRAGIGWLGKHTNVISRDLGSWIFLGEIILNVDLEPDAPMRDFCGSCTACLDACPTHAFPEPYRIDSRRCISYLTIENKGDIAPEFLPDLEGWVFGCDICQDVCPWNRDIRESEEPGFQPREANRAPVLDELVTLTEEGFRTQFRKSTVKRTGLRGLIRNARALLHQYTGKTHTDSKHTA